MLAIWQLGRYRVSNPFFHPFLMNWRIALYLFVQEERGACLIGYLRTLVFCSAYLG